MSCFRSPIRSLLNVPSSKLFGRVTRNAQFPFHRPLSSGLIGPSSDDDYYARHLDFPADLKGFTESGLMWAAAKADAQALEITPEEYMKSVTTRRKKFISDGVLFDRAVLMDSLRNELDERGTFTLLLGGKSVGKSLILRSLAEEYNKAGGKVVVVNMRLTGHTGLTASIVKSIEALDPAFKRDFFVEVLRATVVAASTVALPNFSAPIDTASRAVLDSALKKVAPEEAIAAFATTAAKSGKVACIIVDEANVAFSEKSPEGKERAQSVLRLFTALTKETSMLNVLLASSEYGYPYRMKKELKFNLANIGKTVFAGEVPPACMRELLVEKWGLGPGLSKLCLAAYGGHIYYTAKALSELSLQKQDFAAEDVCPPIVYSGIVQCLDAEAEHPGMTDLLRKVAVSGFAPIEKIDDPRVDMMVKKNVAGFVVKGSLVVGLPRSVWVCGAKYGLIPASQQVRLMIGEVLSREGLL
ncbi:hypothetical protein B484DRAFT_429615 [Ochromonadaceae sp. CCMP2298]|nr:hypothetical protein B484DRAFT_429615 [Ochromonadaceae sp. CCMP2298]